MVSPLIAAQDLPGQHGLAPKSLNNSTRQGVQAIPVPKQNTASVSKVHTGSIQTFSDALDSALSFANVSQPESAGADSAVPSANVTSTTTLLTGTQLGSTDAANQQTLFDRAMAQAGSARASDESAEQSIPEGIDARADRGETSEATAFPSKEAPGTKLSEKTPSGPVMQNSAVPTLVAAPDVFRGPAVVSTLEGGESGAAMAKSDAAAQFQGGRINASGALQRMSPSLGNTDSQPIVAGFATDAEAFRINLYNDFDVLEGNGAVKQDSGMKADTGNLAADQNLPSQGVSLSTRSGQAVENNTPSRDALSGANADSTLTKGVGTTQGLQPGKREVSASGPGDEKGGDKIAANEKPDPQTMGESGAIAAPSAHMPARVMAGKSQNTGSMQPAEVTINDAPTASTPKEMIVRFQGGSGEFVSVRLLDQGGQVQVAVRSSDPLTASQLRQDLTSLTSSLDRIGWRADATVSPTQTVAPHQASNSENESQGGRQDSSLDWREGPDRKRYSTSELWDEALAGQNT